MSTQPKEQAETSTLADDMREMSAYGSFMFLLNDLRIFAKEDETFAPVFSFPLRPAIIQSLVKDNAEFLQEKQTKIRHQAHLEMLQYLTQKGDDIEAPQAPVFLDYNEKSTVDGAPQDELSYSLVLNHSKKRLYIVFRGSVNASDWEKNFDFNQVKVDNPLSEIPNQPPQLTIHRGFYDYVFQKVDDDGKTKIDEIVENTERVLRDNPGYRVYTTGVSLGGALTSVFCVFAAACYPQLGPITCFSYASPKVGTSTFRRLHQHLESNGQLRHVRVTNWADPVILLPREPLILVPCFAVFSMVWISLFGVKSYRHVGMNVVLYKDCEQEPQFYHTKLQNNCCRRMISDWGKIWGRFFICLAHVVCFWKTATQNYRAFHGYPEYWYRVNASLSYFETVSVDQLYKEFFEGDRTHVKTRFM